MKNWKILKTEDVSPSNWLRVLKENVLLPNGKEIEYFVQDLDDVVMVFAINNKNEAIFVRQYKHGAERIMIEFPAGRIDSNNDPENEARREFLEETGYELNDIEFVGTLITEPSKSRAKVYCYFSKNIQLGSAQKFDENEDIEVLTIPLKEINNKIIAGEIFASDTLSLIKLIEVKHPEIFG